jgi:hypothetical protein
MVRCTICNQVEKKETLLVFKLDGLQKHVGCHKTTFALSRVAISEFYMDCLRSMLRTSDNILLFMGKLLWFNKLQIRTL